MATDENNESQTRQEQKEQAHQSPLKKPETETAHANEADVGAAAQGHNPGSKPSPQTGEGTDTSGAPVDTPPREKAMLPEDVRPRGIDVDNDDSSDSTVDTDGKDHDAKRLGRMDDSEVISNASPDNEVPTPPEGLAGIDSRPSGNRPAIQTQDGRSVVIDEGTQERPDLYVSAGGPGVVEEADEHVPPNHPRVGHNIKIVPEDNGR